MVLYIRFGGDEVVGACSKSSRPHCEISGESKEYDIHC